MRPRPEDAPIEHGSRGILAAGHRDYVGGMWDEIGQLQFDFLVGQGLEPHHVLLDVGCGSLRAGVHFIPYLERGHYLGIDKERLLIERGLAEELSREVVEAKAPELVVSRRWEFHRFSRRPDFALAQSIFTHLTPRHVGRCLQRLRRVAPDDCRLFATFFEGVTDNPRRPHDLLVWHYSRADMLAFGERAGWTGRYIGDWGHPRGQVMVEYRPA